MNYKGIEIQPFNECKVFEEPREMLVWNESYTRPIEKLVCAVIPYRREGSVITRGGAFEYCAEIPEEPKPRMATYRELAKWLAQGNGDALVLMQMTNGLSREVVTTSSHYFSGKDNEAVSYGYNGQHCKGVRKWDDTDWHKPTVDYLGLEV